MTLSAQVGSCLSTGVSSRTTDVVNVHRHTRKHAVLGPSERIPTIRVQTMNQGRRDRPPKTLTCCGAWGVLSLLFYICSERELTSTLRNQD